MSIPTAETTEPAYSVTFLVGHKFPNGEIVQHERLDSAQFGVRLFGGEVMTMEVHTYPWMRASDAFQPKWLVPE